MASRPDEPPESIILGEFRGIRNTVGRDRLGPNELETALNIDIDDRGQARRRRGYALKSAGDYHSARTIGGRTLVVKDGILGIVHPDYSFETLGEEVGSDPLSYTQVADTTYFASNSASGKITGTTVEPWGQTDDAGEWISPVITPTDTLGEVFGHQISAPPFAEHIAAHSGRIYLLAGRYLWFTELWMYDYISKTSNFLQLEAEGTMLAAVDNGLFVGTEDALHFLSGTPSEGMRIDKKSDSGAIRGSVVRVPAAEIGQGDGARPEAEAVMFMTHAGICAGTPDGQVVNLTRSQVVLPSTHSAAALYREDSGVSSYVVTADSRGAPTSNARIGDFVDAEIVKRGG